MHKLNKDFISKTPKNRLYGCHLPLIGLTGGIATGKSTVAKILKEKGIPLIDADQLVKKIYKNPKTIKFISSICPEVVLDNEYIDFPKLREIFFEHHHLKEKIENYIYSELPNAFLEEYSKLDLSHFHFIIYDIPLLFEKNLHSFFDLNILLLQSKYNCHK